MGGLVGDDVLHAFAVVAEPAAVAAQIQRRFGGLVDRVSFCSPYETRTETWDLVLGASSRSVRKSGTGADQNLARTASATSSGLRSIRASP